MTLSKAWIKQALSDLQAARDIDHPGDSRSHCQAISKYQQSVEKSVKGVLDKLYAVRLVGQGSDRNHKVARYASVLTGFPTSPDNRDLLNRLRRLFKPSMVKQIVFLDSLVPEYPAPGALAKRNHEYPFQDAKGDWHSPSDTDSFSQGEIKRVRACAGSLVRQLGEILEAFDVVYP